MVGHTKCMHLIQETGVRNLFPIIQTRTLNVPQPWSSMSFALGILTKEVAGQKTMISLVNGHFEMGASVQHT